MHDFGASTSFESDTLVWHIKPGQLLFIRIPKSDVKGTLAEELETLPSRAGNH